MAKELLFWSLLFVSLYAYFGYPILLLIAYLVKIIPSLIFIPKHGARKALSMGILLSARLSLIIAAAEVGFEMGIIDEALRSALILIGVITSVASPILFKKNFREASTE